jgi:hypothetical protein
MYYDNRLYLVPYEGRVGAERVGALVGVSLLSFLFSYFLRLSQPVRTNLVKSGGLFELLFTLLHVYVIVIYVISPVGYLSRMSI